MTNTPQLLDLLGYAQARIARLELTLGVLSLAVLALGGTLAWYAIDGVPVHYIPPGGPGLSRPGIISESAATDFASRVLTARYTFTPATVKAAHAEVATALHPSLTVAFQAQAEREAALVKEAQLSSQVTIAGATVTRPAPPSVHVLCSGTRTIWVGGQQVREEPLHAEMTVSPWPLRGQAAGLAVTRLTTAPALRVAGQ